MGDSYLMFSTKDGLYKLILSHNIKDKMIYVCQKAVEYETGGILVGIYNKEHDTAIIEDISGPTSDSVQTKTEFLRGLDGLQKWLNHLWRRKRRNYYLGEWHYHPYADPRASVVDKIQMQNISINPQTKCPEPVMIIIGGNILAENWDIKAYVCPKRESLKELHIENEGNK